MPVVVRVAGIVSVQASTRTRRRAPARGARDVHQRVRPGRGRRPVPAHGRASGAARRDALTGRHQLGQLHIGGPPPGARTWPPGPATALVSVGDGPAETRHRRGDPGRQHRQHGTRVGRRGCEPLDQPVLRVDRVRRLVGGDGGVARVAAGTPGMPAAEAGLQLGQVPVSAPVRRGRGRPTVAASAGPPDQRAHGAGEAARPSRSWPGQSAAARDELRRSPPRARPARRRPAVDQVDGAEGAAAPAPRGRRAAPAARRRT